jgi:2-hydroxy-6-oxonona-2,4-dienedioate hydrolase
MQQTGNLRSDWTRVDNLCIHARVSLDASPADAPPVVLVHGLVVSSRYLVPLGEDLASEYRVYTPDLPGFGRSDKPSHVLDTAELADYLVSWMRAIGVPRATLIGNSYGCQTIAQVAVRHPECVERAVLIGPTMDVIGRNAPEQVRRLLVDATREPLSAILVQLRDFLDVGPWRAAVTFRNSLRDRIEEHLPQMHFPVLVLRGARDPIVPPRWAATVTQLLPMGQLLTVPGAAHIPNFTAPDELRRIIRPFMAAQTPALELQGRG